jgi:hypothetical protein
MFPSSNGLTTSLWINPFTTGSNVIHFKPVLMCDMESVVTDVKFI